MEYIINMPGRECLVSLVALDRGWLGTDCGVLAELCMSTTENPSGNFDNEIKLFKANFVSEAEEVLSVVH